MVPALDFDALVRRYHAPLIRRAAALVRSREDAEDVVQAVWMKLAASGWRGDCAISSWLYLLTSHEALNHLRRRKARGRPAQHATLEDAAREPSPMPSPEDYAVASERADVIRARLVTLTRKQKRLLLAATRGETRVALARRRRAPVNTVKTQLNRIRRKLR